MKHVLQLAGLWISILLGTTAGEDSETCNKKCDRSYVPHCGSDGVTYSNACTFEIALCENPELKVKIGQECDRVDRNKECPNKCPLNYSPRCGSDGVTYGNLCEFEVGQCLDGALILQHEGACATSTASPDNDPIPGDTNCSASCGEVFNPICGSDGTTYTNLCTFTVAQCLNPELSAVSSSTCSRRSLRERRRSANDPKCNQICNFEYDPKCGSDGILYGNQCELDTAACRNPTVKLVPLAPGEACVAISKVPKSCEKDCKDAELFVHCGTNGIDYPSLCDFEVAQCLIATLRLAHRAGTRCTNRDGPRDGKSKKIAGGIGGAIVDESSGGHEKRRRRQDGTKTDNPDEDPTVSPAAGILDTSELGLDGKEYLTDDELPDCPIGWDIDEVEDAASAQARNVRGARKDPKLTSWTTGKWPPCKPRDDSETQSAPTTAQPTTAQPTKEPTNTPTTGMTNFSSGSVTTEAAVTKPDGETTQPEEKTESGRRRRRR